MVENGDVASSFTIVTEARVDARALFDASLDIDVHAASMARSKERAVAGVTTGRIGLGETVTWRARHFGVWFTMTSRITGLEPPRYFVDEQLAGPFQRFRHEHLFERIATGCRMTDTITVASPFLGVLAERLVLVPYLRRLIRMRNRALLTAAGASSER